MPNHQQCPTPKNPAENPQPTPLILMHALVALQTCRNTVNILFFHAFFFLNASPVGVRETPKTRIIDAVGSMMLR